MKKIILFLSVITFLFSCSNDDDNSTQPTPKNYFPQNSANSWTYENSLQNTITTKFNGESVISGLSYQKIINESPIFGFQGNSNIRKAGDEYFITGDYTISPQLPSFPLESKLFLKESATNGATINQFSMERNLDSQQIPVGTFNVTITPKVIVGVKIQQLNKYAEKQLNGTNYEDVLEIFSTYTLKCDLIFSGTGAISINDHNLIPEVQVITLKQYYANNIGVVRSEFVGDFSNIEYNTSVPTPLPTGPVDLSPYLGAIENYFNNSNFNVTSELSTYTVL